MELAGTVLFWIAMLAAWFGASVVLAMPLGKMMARLGATPPPREEAQHDMVG